MKTIKTLQDFINEKKLVIKRKYTEKYPTKRVSTAARVRNTILDAIGDGVITQDELENILADIDAHKRWLKRNRKLFRRTRQDGESKICLSKKGKKIRNATLDVNEALSIPHKEQGDTPVNIFVGRFQPFTLGHVKVLKKLHEQNGYPVVVFLIRAKKFNPEKTPFTEDIQQSMFAKMTKEFKFLEGSYIIPTAAIDTIFSILRPTYEPVLWGFGTDRKTYRYQIDNQRYRQELNVRDDFSGFEIKRDDSNISASKVRNAIQIDDIKSFKKMTPKSIHSFYQELQSQLQPIQESLNFIPNFDDFLTEDGVQTTEIPPMGDVELPTETETGSGDIPTQLSKDNKKKTKKLETFDLFMNK